MFYFESNLKLEIVLFLAHDKTINISKIKYRNVGEVHIYKVRSFRIAIKESKNSI